MLTLYGNPGSTCTRKVLTLLAERNAEHTFVNVDLGAGEHKQPAHIARQPFGQVPAIDHDGFELYESRAILRYLDEVLPGERLTPNTARARGLMEQWISVETSNFTPHAMKIIYQAVFGRWRGAAPDMAKIAEGREAVAKTLEVLETQLTRTPYLVGEQFTLADIGYLPYIEYLFAGEQGDLITSQPNTAAWWARISGRPSWQRVAGHAK